jgi:hypothetical protein
MKMPAFVIQRAIDVGKGAKDTLRKDANAVDFAFY